MPDRISSSQQVDAPFASTPGLVLHLTLVLLILTGCGSGSSGTVRNKKPNLPRSNVKVPGIGENAPVPQEASISLTLEELSRRRDIYIQNLIAFKSDTRRDWLQAQMRIESECAPYYSEQDRILMKTVFSGSPTDAKRAREALHKKGEIFALFGVFHEVDLPAWESARKKAEKLGDSAKQELAWHICFTLLRAHEDDTEHFIHELDRMEEASILPATAYLFFENSLTDPNLRIHADTRKRFGRVLVRLALRHKTAEEMLKDANQHETDYVRIAVMESYAIEQDPRGVDIIKGHLKDPKWEIRGRAADSLGELSDPAAGPALIDALDDEDISVRKAAARALGRVGDPKGIKPLVEIIRTRGNLESLEEKQFAKIAAYAIIDMARRAEEREDVSVIVAINDLIKTHPDPLVRLEGVNGLAALGTERANAMLLGVLAGGRQTPRVVERIIVWAGESEYKAALPYVYNTMLAYAPLKNQRPAEGQTIAFEARVYYRTIWAMEKLSGETFGDDIDKWTAFMKTRR